MVKSVERHLVAFALLTIAASSFAQGRDTFAYTGDDALPGGAKEHLMVAGGLANSFLVDNSVPVWPWMPAVYGQVEHRVFPGEHRVNVGVGAVPEVFLVALFMARVTVTADLLLFREAGVRSKDKVGLRMGFGYSALGSTFGYQQQAPVVRAGLLIDRFRISYMRNLTDVGFIDHQIMAGVVMEL